MNGLVVDLARHPDVSWAVIVGDQLLPVRFSPPREAEAHLSDLLTVRAKAAAAGQMETA